MRSFVEFLEERMENLDLQEKEWIQDAINQKHKGFCTPITKKTCTPRRKALALRFKKGGDLHSGKKD